MKVFINRMTNEVEGVNLTPDHLSLEVDVKETLAKSITEIDHKEPLVQKLDEQGNPLYKDYSEDGLTYEEVHYEDGKKPIEFVEEEVINSYIDEKGLEHTETVVVQVPTEYKELEPVMVDNYTTTMISIKEKPSAFTVEEVLKDKYSNLLEDSLKDYILADMFLNEEDIDLEDANHSANTGLYILDLHPNGQAKTKAITLEAPATTFELLEFDAPKGVEIYLGGKKFVNGKLTLSSPVSNCTLKFVNTTDKFATVKSYAIAY